MKKLLFIVNPRAGRTRSMAPMFDVVAHFSQAGYLIKLFTTEGPLAEQKWLRHVSVTHD